MRPLQLTQPGPLLFAAGGAFQALELQGADVPVMQRFFDANPEYNLLINGEPPGPGDAQDEFEEAPPPDMPHGRLWWIAFTDAQHTLHGIAHVVADLLAPGVWHVGLFIAATALHGQGAAHAMYQALERWMAAQGAQWLRLGVVQGNARAEAFWLRQGYVEVRQRHDVPTGARRNTIRVMVKPAGADHNVSNYLAVVGRDRPE
jgi:GNAT superfamily N-acetyltransferase